MFEVKTKMATGKQWIETINGMDNKRLGDINDAFNTLSEWGMLFKEFNGLSMIHYMISSEVTQRDNAEMFDARQEKS